MQPPRRILLRLFVGLSVVLTLGLLGWEGAHAEDGVVIATRGIEPSNVKPGKSTELVVLYVCYDIFTHEPVRCQVEHRVLGLKTPAGVCDPEDPLGVDKCNNGGHFHNGSRPLVLVPPGKLLSNAPDDLADDPLAVKARTTESTEGEFAGRALLITHKLPEVSGVLAITGTKQYLDGYRCARPEDCLPDDNPRTRTQLDIDLRLEVKGLTQLSGGVGCENPGDVTADHYIKIRGGVSQNDPVCTDGRHTEEVAFAAAPLTLSVLPKIATEYHRLFTLTNRNVPLSINDISLPRGGKFDIAGTWTGDHVEHRAGKEVDINTGSSGTPNCKADKNLRLATDQHLAGVERLMPNGDPKLDPDTDQPYPFSALLCEEEGKRHIDVEEFAIPTQLDNT